MCTCDAQLYIHYTEVLQDCKKVKTAKNKTILQKIQLENKFIESARGGQSVSLLKYN